MQKLFRGRWWVAGLLLTVSCRSEQAAFSFRPAMQPVLSTVAVAPTSVAVAPTAPPAPAPLASTPLAAPIAMYVAPSAIPAVRPGARMPKQAASKLGRLVYWRASRPETAARAAHHDTLHWVLGGALVVAGVVTGILLGGWLGLGVGAALVLLGYYFVLKALGGRQAWLEVFQEFFNM